MSGAALNVKMILDLVDRASGPARGVMARIMGGGGALKNQKRNLDGVGGSAHAASGAMYALTRSASTFAAGAGAYLGFKSTIGAAMEFETALADVSKKVKASPEEFARLTKEIEKIATKTPLAKAEVAALVAQAGQFGIANHELMRFAELGAKASVAFDMESPEATADALSQMKNALQLNMKELENYADMINYVADANGSSEQQLIDFTLRTGAGAKAAGLDPTDLLAIGSAMTEVGISSSRAGTATNAMLTKMIEVGKKGKILDKVGGKGYSKKLQKEFFETPRKALVDMLKASKELSRPDRANFFKDLFGLETQDEANALAGNIDKVVKTVTDLGNAKNYAGSVKSTYDIFAGTTAQQWETFKQNLEDTGSVWGAKVLPQINDTLKYLNEAFTQDEGRVDIFERMSLALDGLNQGFGGSSNAAKTYLADMEAGFKQLRDLIFGVQGEDPGNVQSMTIFERWKQYGEEVGAAFDSAREKYEALKRAIAGESTSEDLKRYREENPDAFGPSKHDREVDELRRNSPPKPDDGLTDRQRSRIEGGWQEPKKPQQGPPTPTKPVLDEATRLRIEAGMSTPSSPVSAPSDPAGIFQKFLSGMDKLGAGAQSSGPQAVNVAGPVTTVPSGIQQVQVTNQPPILAPINISISMTSNASPEAVAATVGGEVRAALHGAGGRMVE